MTSDDVKRDAHKFVRWIEGPAGYIALVLLLVVIGSGAVWAVDRHANQQLSDQADRERQVFEAGLILSCIRVNDTLREPLADIFGKISIQSSSPLAPEFQRAQQRVKPTNCRKTVPTYEELQVLDIEAILRREEEEARRRAKPR